MFSRNGRISLRQGFRLFVFDFVGISSLVVLPYLARTVGSGGVFSIVLGTVWGLVYLLYLYEVHGKMNTDLGTFMQQFVPTPVRVAVQLWLIVHCAAAAGFAAYLFGVLIQYSLLEDESFIIIIAIILAVAAYAVSGGIESRARVYELLFWFVLLPLIVTLAAGGTQIKLPYFGNIMDAGFWDMLHGSYVVFLFFTTAFWVLFMTRYLAAKPQAEGMWGLLKEGGCRKAQVGSTGRKLQQVVGSKQDTRGLLYKKIAGAVVLAGVLLAAAYLVCLGNFGEASMAGMNFPIITLMSSIRIPGNFVKRLDAVMIAVWFFTLFAFLNLHLFYAAQVMRGLVKDPQSDVEDKAASKANGRKHTGSRNKSCEGGENIEAASKADGRKHAGGRKNSGERISTETGMGGFVAVAVIFAAAAALACYYASAAREIFLAYFYYAGTPLMVVSPVIIYWFGKRRQT